MKIFATIKFYYGAAVISFIAAGIMVPLMFLFNKNYSRIIHFWNKVMIMFIGGKIATKGKRDNSADMFVMNHQGIIDIIAMEAAEESDLRWVAKKQLFDAPWFGYVLKLPNMIEVDREDKSGLTKLIRDVKESKEELKRTVAIFPEGTRTEEQALLPFKGGTRIIANKLELRIQPIVITNSKQLLNEHNKTAHNATVHINYLDTFQVDKSDKEWYKNLQIDMQIIIDEEKNKYERER